MPPPPHPTSEPRKDGTEDPSRIVVPEGVCVAVEVGHKGVLPQAPAGGWKPDCPSANTVTGHPTGPIDDATPSAPWWQDDKLFLRFHIAQTIVWLGGAVVFTYLSESAPRREGRSSYDDRETRVFMFHIYAAVQCWGFFLGSYVCIIATRCQSTGCAMLNLFFVYPVLVIGMNVGWLAVGFWFPVMVAHVPLGIMMAIINAPTFARLARDVRMMRESCCVGGCDTLLIAAHGLSAMANFGGFVFSCVVVAYSFDTHDYEDPWGPFFAVLLLFCFCAFVITTSATAFLVSHFRITLAEAAASGPLSTEVNYQHLRKLRSTTWRKSFASLFLCCFYGCVGPALIATPFTWYVLLGPLLVLLTLCAPVVVKAHRVTVTCCRDAMAYDDVLPERNE